jgi:hypothetical protein
LEEGDAFVMNASTWVEIVSTLSPGILLPVWSDAEPGGGESKHTCNAGLLRQFSKL